MKFLIAGLGNPGEEYANTRHNAGFRIAEKFAEKHGAAFSPARYADYAKVVYKGKQLHIIKPTTFMNLSGKALRYWMLELGVETDRILVLVDDLAIPFGRIRIRRDGSDAGHNGLKSISELLETENYPRLRFGIGNDFPKGKQMEFVLGKWNTQEENNLSELYERSSEAIACFALMGLEKAMNLYNK